MRTQIEALRESGYVVIPGFAPVERLTKLNDVARSQLAARLDPLELEVDLQYPGAPPSRAAAGGETVRRLLDAYGRHPEFAEVAIAARLREWMETYFGEAVSMSRAHHNCLMTKHPLYGTMTGWHRDMRFWSFEREDLVSVWVALGEESVDNGALWFVPGSHRMAFDTGQFDQARFFRTDRAGNAELLRKADSPHLMPGDAVLFHCNTLHSAGKNLRDEVKFSLVYTYHARNNAPVVDTRSASKHEVQLCVGGQPR
ncbi:MAG TPA: phytanoyl-CoA dioxygenase family protein [Steroidobacteraceae bacterium]|nr:phytanoyl-CoA dioxygenase family protein [Steroidobacteraceae bacterium]